MQNRDTEMLKTQSALANEEEKDRKSNRYIGQSYGWTVHQKNICKLPIRSWKDAQKQRKIQKIVKMCKLK